MHLNVRIWNKGVYFRVFRCSFEWDKVKTNRRCSFTEWTHLLFVCRNIVSTVNLGCPLDLKFIALQARNAEYNPKVLKPADAPSVSVFSFKTDCCSSSSCCVSAFCSSYHEDPWASNHSADLQLREDGLHRSQEVSPSDLVFYCCKKLKHIFIVWFHICCLLKKLVTNSGLINELFQL